MFAATNLTGELERRLKERRAQLGTTYAAVLRESLAAYFEMPKGDAKN